MASKYKITILIFIKKPKIINFLICLFLKFVGN